jgi:hypothetical protein
MSTTVRKKAAGDGGTGEFPGVTAGAHAPMATATTSAIRMFART